METEGTTSQTVDNNVLSTILAGIEALNRSMEKVQTDVSSLSERLDHMESRRNFCASTLRHHYVSTNVDGSNLILSAKHSLATSAQQLPLMLTKSVLTRCCIIYCFIPGYICNIIESGIFIRYLGRLTGFSPRNRATDDRRSSLSEVYQIGQSVRTNVVDVSSETSRITVSLKQYFCSSTDASFIQEYFLVESSKWNPCGDWLKYSHSST
ncbi:rRNA biogenesis protein RRP5-like [Capsicum annuum]|uniref:rRNA biogenesis protein RRP5-like n=1 Tax=Capsicum annuum TaxID=4072 RepID=UPI001FB07FD6|nr:rRNA biogenesis protein RRP5-like [Capsicum annuum]